MHSRSRRAPTSARAGARRPTSNRCAPTAQSNKGNRGKEWTPADCMAVVPTCLFHRDQGRGARPSQSRGPSSASGRCRRRRRRAARPAPAAHPQTARRRRWPRPPPPRPPPRPCAPQPGHRRRPAARSSAARARAPAPRRACSCCPRRAHSRVTRRRQAGSGGMRVPCRHPLRLRALWPRPAHLRQSLSAARAPAPHSSPLSLSLSLSPAFLGSPPDHQESDRRAKTTVSRTPGAPRGAWARRGSTTGRQLARCKARPPDWADTMMPPTGSATTSAALALYARPHGLRTAMHRAGQAFAKERRLSSGSSASTTSTTHGPGRRTGCPAWPSGCRNTRARTAAGARPPACSAR
jgi:hypothetical protein